MWEETGRGLCEQRIRGIMKKIPDTVVEFVRLHFCNPELSEAEVSPAADK
jgi:hypothetical protein